MPVQYIYDDILNVKTDTIICHQVNCRGVMGAGLALQIKNKFPYAYTLYKDFCSEKDYKPLWLLGRILITNTEGQYIAHIFSQDGYGFSKQVYTNY